MLAQGHLKPIAKQQIQIFGCKICGAFSVSSQESVIFQVGHFCLVRFGLSDLSGKFVLGPMAGYTDIAFRLICRKKGAAMCFTEFANATAIVRGIDRAEQLTYTCSEEMPVGIQIFGSDAEIMAQACRKISQRAETGECPASCIDLNFGCPASRVVKAGAGSALLKKPEKIGEIVRACVSASSLPITTKIRSGWDSDKAPMIARIIEDAGAVGITVHWRTACEGRKRNIGWESVSEVKRSVGIPVIGNGGAYSPELAVRFLKEAQCDAVMISSAALGNPAIFTQSNLLLEGKPTFQYSWKEKKADFLEYFSLAKKHGCFSLKRLKAHAAQFFSGKPGAKKARVALAAAKTEEDVLQILHKL